MKVFLLFFLVFIVTVVFDIPDGSFFLNFLFNISILFFSFLVFLFFNLKFEFEKDVLILFLFLFLFFIFYSFVDTKISIALLLLIFVSFLVGWLIGKIALFDKDRFLKILNLVIFIHFCFLFAQYVSVNFMNFNVNFHEILFPFSSGHTYQLKNLEYTRITGLYNEPGTYSTWIAIITLLSILISRKINLFHYVSFFSILLTFSATGFFYCLVFGFLVLFEKIKYLNFKNFIFIFLFLILISSLAIYIGVVEYIQWRFLDDSVEDGTFNLKLEALKFLMDANFSRQFFGSGLGVNDCLNCKSIQDVGLLFNYLFYFGYLFVIPLLLIFGFVKKINIIIVIFLFILFSSKMFIYSNLFWISIFLLYYLPKIDARKYV